MDLEQFKYPIGQFVVPDIFDQKQVDTWISEIEALPGQIKKATENLTDEELNQTYRPGGWTLRQVVHHVRIAISMPISVLSKPLLRIFR